MFPNLNEAIAEIANWNYWSFYMAQDYHVCKVTNIREIKTTPDKCLICKFCETEKLRKERESNGK